MIVTHLRWVTECWNYSIYMNTQYSYGHGSDCWITAKADGIYFTIPRMS